MFLNAASRAAIREHDTTWLPKFILRLVLALVCIIVIICIAWAVGTTTPGDILLGVEVWQTVWSLIPLGISIVWTIISLPILVARRKPVHPGLNVAFDLILCIMFIIVAIYTTAEAIIGVQNQPDDPYVGDEYDDGSTYNDGTFQAIAINGTTVTVTPQNQDSCPLWNSCAEEANFLSLQRRRAIVALGGCVFVCLAAVVHFVLFVLACIDTHCYRRKTVESTGQKIAEKIIADMRNRGELPTHTQPMLTVSRPSGSNISPEDTTPAQNVSLGMRSPDLEDFSSYPPVSQHHRLVS